MGEGEKFKPESEKQGKKYVYSGKGHCSRINRKIQWRK